MKKTMLNCLTILITCIVLAFLLMVLVTIVPTNRIQENLKKSISTFEREGSYYPIMTSYDAALLDNVTDVIYLNQALMHNDSEGLLTNALGGYNFYANDDEEESGFYKLLYAFDDENENNITKKAIHLRYWNGYLIILKPLLVFMSYGNIRQLNMILQMIIISFILYLMFRRNLQYHIAGFLIAYLFLNPISMSLNFFFSMFFYCTFIPCLIMLYFDEKLQKNNRYLYFFLIVGICCTFFNMNSFQLITWGFPLIFVFVIEGMPKEIIIFLKKCISYSVAWGIGYAAMYVSKWILAGLLTDLNVYGEVYSTVTSRLSTKLGVSWAPEIVDRFAAVRINVSHIFSNKILMFFELLFIGWIVLEIFINRKSIPEIDDKSYICKLIIFIFAMILVPCVRCIILSNHSYIHHSYVHRIFVLPIFALNVGICLYMNCCKRKL